MYIAYVDYPNEQSECLFVKGVSSKYEVAANVSNYLTERNKDVDSRTRITPMEIRRFITIYGEYISLNGEPLDSCTPIFISERKNGATTTYCKPYGLSDSTVLQPIPITFTLD